MDAIQYCHNKGIVHRDLKVQNVLFKTTEHKVLKVCDFGIAGICRGGESDKNEAATLRYMTPEMIHYETSVANPAMDVWTIGILVYEMLFNKKPFDGKNRDEIKKNILKSPFQVSRYSKCTPEVIDFLNKCLEKNPKYRMKTTEMVMHPWLLLSDD